MITTTTAARRCDCGRPIRHSFKCLTEICVRCIARALEGNRAQIRFASRSLYERGRGRR